MRIKRILAPTLLAACSIALLVQLPIAIAARASDYELFDPVIDVRNILEERFVDESRIDSNVMQLAMINAMIDTLDDPYTEFIPESLTREFEKNLRGRYVGIGCEVNIVDGQFTIVSPMVGSPALEAGVLAGDIVLEIDGESIVGDSITETIDRLIGEPDTFVTIRVRHLDSTEETIEIIRRQIVTQTVKGLRRVGDDWNHCVDNEFGLAYVHVTQFNESTIRELSATLESLQTEGLNGLVFDLRDNPGGDLAAAVEMSDLFLEQGTIVSVRPRRGSAATFNAKRVGTLPDFPMVILVNGQSASASEIVSGALQENGRARVIGTRTFGKGSVQEVRELDYDRGTLKVTTAHYYLASGRNLNRSDDSIEWGVDPDAGMIVPITDEEYVEMFRAKRDYEIIRDISPDTPECVDAEWIRENLRDKQLAHAVKALGERLETGEWPEITEDLPAQTAFNRELSRAVEARQRLVEQLDLVENRIAELQNLAARVGTPPLLPPDVDLIEGMISIRDKYGNLVGSYRIEGGDVELALNGVRLSPIANE